MQVKSGNLVRIKNKSANPSESNALIARDYRNDASNEIIADDRQDVKQYSLAGDVMDVAQKMVDEAAKAAGYSIKVYHGTSSEFTTFQRGNKRTRGSLNFGSGFYFSPKRSFAENYTTTGRVIEG